MNIIQHLKSIIAFFRGPKKDYYLDPLDPLDVPSSISPKETKEDRIIVPKGWGEEEWIVNNQEYCGKILRFNKNKKCSLHYHINKHETFLCTKGKFLIEFGQTEDCISTCTLSENESFEVERKLLHRMTGLDEVNELIEFSTHHEDSDSYRVQKGD